MTQEERKAIMYAQGRANALALQDKAADMTGTELYAQDGDIPSFKSVYSSFIEEESNNRRETI